MIRSAAEYETHKAAEPRAKIFGGGAVAISGSLAPSLKIVC